MSPFFDWRKSERGSGGRGGGAKSGRGIKSERENRRNEDIRKSITMLRCI